MKVLFTTNVVLDALLAREPHAGVAIRLISLADRGQVEGLLCATTVMTIHYIAAKSCGRRRAARHLSELLAIFAVAPVNGDILSRALEQRFPDYEDAVLHEAARGALATGIVTRNRRDFRGASLPVFAPDELLSVLLAGGKS